MEGQGLIVLRAFIKDQRGATAIEYALIASLVSIFVIGALTMFEAGFTDLFQYISDNISTELSSGGG